MDPSSRDNIRKRGSTVNSATASTSAGMNTYADLLGEIQKKAKHDTQESILIKMNHLETCVSIDEELKEKLRDQYIAELKENVNLK